MELSQSLPIIANYMNWDLQVMSDHYWFAPVYGSLIKANSFDTLRIVFDQFKDYELGHNEVWLKFENMCEEIIDEFGTGTVEECASKIAQTIQWIKP